MDFISYGALIMKNNVKDPVSAAIVGERRGRPR
jgi:hypothetical protein